MKWNKKLYRPLKITLWKNQVVQFHKVCSVKVQSAGTNSRYEEYYTLSNQSFVLLIKGMYNIRLCSVASKWSQKMKTTHSAAAVFQFHEVCSVRVQSTRTNSKVQRFLHFYIFLLKEKNTQDRSHEWSQKVETGVVSSISKLPNCEFKESKFIQCQCGAVLETKKMIHNTQRIKDRRHRGTPEHVH